MSFAKVHLLLIDPQHDFCNPQGNLYVTGAENDMLRIADMIARLGGKLEDIHVTLDQHHLIDVAHPAMWKNASSQQPDPFTIITSNDIKNAVWYTTQPDLTPRMIAYTEALEASGRYPLCIWPPHCLIGSPGATVVPEVLDALNKWADKKFKTIDFVSKGSNIFTEHYSGVKAEVPDPNDPTTQLNTRLIQTLEKTDMVLIAGEAGSHCLANTVRDVADGFSDPKVIEKLVLLADGTSPVQGFENLQDDFIKEMTAKGMKLSTTTKVLV
jgi:nicotinamidase-related amidase